MGIIIITEGCTSYIEPSYDGSLESKKKPNCLNLRQRPLLINNWLNVWKQLISAIQNRDGFAAILLTLLKLKYKGDNFKKALGPFVNMAWIPFQKEGKGELAWRSTYHCIYVVCIEIRSKSSFSYSTSSFSSWDSNM